ncbi:hypothetical protein BDN72DRAFT_965014 [Pluteus cervinus]|uniref:Uncharacterized protein n=1 Tax=Pluteus cervinus TaxID=181527 RepID=A0ACD3A8G6_9AGAR|nr:hypothetical protein BDN72DRAFT_965014 [Pluteus cervinus]
MLDQPREVFPPELEEVIFSLALHADWESAQHLILVAKRVNQWLIPQIYQVAILSGKWKPRVYLKNKRRAVSDEKKLTHYGKYVRHIMVYGPLVYAYDQGVHNVGETLLACPHVFNVALWITADKYDKILVAQLLTLRLTHLSFDIGAFKTVHAQDPPTLLPISFPSVTHFEHISSVNIINHAEIRGYFPALTHLALNPSVGNEMFTSPDILKALNDRQMKALIWYGNEVQSPSPVEIPFPQNHRFDDPRIVMLAYGQGYLDTWYNGTRGGSSLWRVADKIIAARRVASHAQLLGD